VALREVTAASCRLQVATLRQFTTQRRCSAVQLATQRRCGATLCATCNVAILRRAVQLARQRRCDAGTAATRNATLQRYAMYATIRSRTAGGAWLLCSDGSRRHHLNYYFF